MAFRYCPGCGEWLETYEYDVGEGGELVCPDHKAVHGHIPGSGYTRERFFHEHPSWYDDRVEMFEAAKDKGLINEGEAYDI